MALDLLKEDYIRLGPGPPEGGLDTGVAPIRLGVAPEGLDTGVAPIRLGPRAAPEELHMGVLEVASGGLESVTAGHEGVTSSN